MRTTVTRPHLIVVAATAAGLWACATPTGTSGDSTTNSDGIANADSVDPATQAREAFARAAEVYSSSKGRDVAGSRAGFETAMTADPTFSLARYTAAVWREAAGRLDAAKRLYREALDVDPTLDLAANNLGLLLERSGQGEAARALYAEIIEKHPEAVSARLRMAALARADGDPKTASKLAREALHGLPQVWSLLSALEARASVQRTCVREEIARRPFTDPVVPQPTRGAVTG